MHYVKIYHINTDSMAVILNFNNDFNLFLFFSKSQLSVILSRDFLVDLRYFKLLWNDIVIKQKNKEEKFRASISSTWIFWEKTRNTHSGDPVSVSNLKPRPPSYEPIIQTTWLRSLVLSEVEAITYSQTHATSLCCCIMLFDVTVAL